MCGWSALADGLPFGYTQVPWIESNGKQWIVTDYNLHVNNVAEKNGYVDEKVEVKIRPISATKWTGRDTVFGAFAKTQTNYQGSPDGVNGSFVLCLNDYQGTGNSSEVWAWTAQWAFNGASTFIIPHGEDCVLAMDGKLRKHYCDGVAKNTQAGAYDELSPLCFFGGKMPGSGVSTTADPDAARTSSIRLYYAKIYNSSGELVFDAVPVRHDNATIFAKRYGLYDLIGGKYYPNNGSTDPFRVPEGYGLTITINRSAYASDAEASAALVSALANDAKTGDIVKVGPGTYALSATTGPVVIKSGVKMVAADANPVHTVIDGGNEVNCVTVNNVQDAEKASLAGFTLTRGKAVATSSSVRGGGLLVNRTTAGFSVSNCVVSCCRGEVLGSSSRDSYGVAIYAAGGITMTDVKVENNLIEQNVDMSSVQQFPKAGAVYLTKGGTIDRCLFRTNVYDLGSSAFHNWTKWQGMGWVSIVGTASTIRDSVFEGNYATNRAAKTRVYVLRNDAPDTIAGLYIGVAGSTVERCVFKNCLTGSSGGIDLASKTTVRDCSFAKNGAMAEWGRGGSGHVGAAGCVFSGCDFDNEYSGSYADALEVDGAGLVLSNCVVRNMSNHTGNCPVFGLGAVGMTNVLCVFEANTVCSIYQSQATSQRGMLFDRCLYKNGRHGANYQGLLYLPSQTSANSGERAAFRSCLFQDNHIQSLMTAALGGTAGKQIVVDACTFDNTAIGSGYLIGVASCSSSISGVAFQELVDICNTCFAGCYSGTSARAPFESNWGTDYAASISNCACSCADSVMAANASNLTSVNPKFRDPAHGNYSLKGSSPLRGKGVKSDWMDQTADLGEGFEYATGAYTIHPCGETHTVGATVAIKKPKMRAPGAKTNIGAFGYHPAGAALLLK